METDTRMTNTEIPMISPIIMALRTGLSSDFKILVVIVGDTTGGLVAVVRLVVVFAGLVVLVVLVVFFGLVGVVGVFGAGVGVFGAGVGVFGAGVGVFGGVVVVVFLGFVVVVVVVVVVVFFGLVVVEVCRTLLFLLIESISLLLPYISLMFSLFRNSSRSPL
jgi:hypothetical protein